MPAHAMTPEAKKLLATTIQSLRARLLTELHDATESAYQLSIPRARDAALTEAGHKRRGRLEAWIGEQVRGAVEATLAEKRKPTWDAEKTAEERARIEAKLVADGLRTRIRADVEKAAAYTLLNRLVLLRLLEAGRHATAQVVTGGWQSGGYRAFREMNAGLVIGDESEGYAFLLQMVFEDLAGELPGLFGTASVSELVPVPTPTLRHAVEALDVAELASCWTDDMTLGWVYQYWNDPERKLLDDKVNAGGKVERHEIASKTQMFTERYMVDWLLQNSLGPMWLAMCQKQGWTAECVGAAESDGTLARLEERRIAWRAKRDAGEVTLTALMPVAPGMEQRWAYFVPQPIPADAVEKAAASVYDLRIIDPAVGSGHFLVVAFDLLVALYREEARHRGEVGQPKWTDKAICERILEHNLSGIDLDPRAVQIAAAALWLKARQTCTDAHPRRINLVAAALKLGSLPEDDAAVVELRREVERETGIPGTLTDTLIQALKGADHLGSLLKVDAEVEAAIAKHEAVLSRVGDPTQMPMFGAPAPQQLRIAIRKEEAKATVLDRIEGFLARHTRGDDLGLRLRGEQLAAGVRFVRLVREGSYDLVVGNPPYQGTAKMDDAVYVQKTYPRGKADLYAAFLERGLQLVREGGTSALLTMRNWMFIKQYVGLRTWLLETYDLRALGDFDKGAFESVPDEVVSVVTSVFRKASPAPEESVALQPTALDDRSRDSERTGRKRGAVLAGVGRVGFRVEGLRVVPEWPVVYWWESSELRLYSSAPLIGNTSPGCVGATTSNGARFTRRSWEVASPLRSPWSPFVSGAQGLAWIEPVRLVVDWGQLGLRPKSYTEHLYGTHTRQIRNEHLYFRHGVAFSMIGADFGARIHRAPSVFGDMGSSVFPIDPVAALCVMNAAASKRRLQSLNPTIHFQVGDVNRLPLFPIANADDIFAAIEAAFGVHESHREPSVEFKSPGPSPWRHAQEWAQIAVDRAEGAPLPPYASVDDPEPRTDHVSYALGCALGRFGREGEGILDPATADLSDTSTLGTLPSGILFLNGTLDAGDRRDSLGQPAAAILHHAWDAHGGAIAPGTSLRDYLRTDFFSAVHRQMYDNRPIHWPLSSKKKSFVAWVTIHRWTAGTLRDLLADHLQPTLTRLTGEVADLRATRDGLRETTDKTAAKNAEKRLAKVKPALDELAEFIAAVEACAEAGPPPLPGTGDSASGGGCKPREVDARYAPDLDDGVMINAAALWPLLAPQWKDPAKWWKELAGPAASKGTDKKHYDWAHLAMRYWPTRVDKRCQEDPSLGVAHGCFWAYHPKRAWAWELRLQDEIGPSPEGVGFRIAEAPYRPPNAPADGGDVAHRAAYLKEHALEALATVETEVLRRRRKKKAPQETLVLLESGLWTAEPRACWDLELEIIRKQGAEFRLLAPDEPGPRASLIAEHPQLVPGRRQCLEAAQQSLRFATPEPDEGEAAEEGDDGEGEVTG
jgi:hypothetical protein